MHYITYMRHSGGELRLTAPVVTISRSAQHRSAAVWSLAVRTHGEGHIILLPILTLAGTGTGDDATPMSFSEMAAEALGGSR